MNVLLVFEHVLKLCFKKKKGQDFQVDFEVGFHDRRGFAYRLPDVACSGRLLTRREKEGIVIGKAHNFAK